ncbi:unnamed protein product [Lactuca saligna]|uniref:Uncharacterized protein n=1 Tax=Lactuca saligna TaxID=75948 RepID=A0AA35VIN3_LACSI|nr:unnamed protein product [Lactuca saligna]
MYGDVTADSWIIRAYKEFKRSGPRDLTPEMLKSIHDADKSAPRGKKAYKGKQVAKGVKGPSQKKRKPTKPAQSPQLKRRKTQPKRKLIIASSSSESEVTPFNFLFKLCCFKLEAADPSSPQTEALLWVSLLSEDIDVDVMLQIVRRRTWLLYEVSG